ncbi:MAG: ATP-binding protein [Opitutaceae bacterium]
MYPRSFAKLRQSIAFGMYYRRTVCGIAWVLTLGTGTAAWAMPSAPAGVIETGAPSFVVMGPEALGLSSAPTDIQVLPDGRVLAVSQRELAFGDGVRWETFREADDQPPIFASVAVDRDGQIYVGANRAIARVDLDGGGRWRLVTAAKLPASAVSENTDVAYVVSLSNQWCWYGGTDAIVSWKPGQEARIIGRVGGVEQIFSLGGDVFTSMESSVGLLRLNPDGTASRVLAGDNVVSETVTCAIPFGAGQLLVGTRTAGLRLFDGKAFRGFGPAGLLNNRHRITALCAAGGDLFAAAVDTVGVVFFDREGRTVQVLGRSFDHRLARVRQLRYSPVGVLWALLDDGVARIEFPSPVSHFEPLILSGLGFAQPVRHAGLLWIVADGLSMRGAYDAFGRLDRFEDDSPPGRFVFTLQDVEGHLFASSEKGTFVYTPRGWAAAFPTIINARIGAVRPGSGLMYYVARGEYGVIRQEGDGFVARRIPAPGLGDSYNTAVDSAGTAWLELGVSKIGRINFHGNDPVLQVFGASRGLGEGWIELYVLDGIARFHWGGHVYRFDEVLRRFVDDRELVDRYPQLARAGGRPVSDSLGRLWFTNPTAPDVIDRSGARPAEIPNIGFGPTEYTPEDDGVVWMFERRHLVRYDPRFPMAPKVPLRALITSVQLPVSNRQFFSPGPALEPLGHNDNSLIIHFAAPANPFAATITFEVQLEGLGTHWVSTGTAGSAAFNQLKEGDYVFHVRPVAGGTVRGGEARLAFTVKTPWFRSTFAWIAYVVSALGMVGLAIWLSSYLQHRENVRLEHLVAKRTGELNAINAQLGRQVAETTEKSAALAASEERYRLLNAELEKRVTERTAQLEATLEQLAQSRKMEAMGQLAGGVAHDFNNVLTAMLMQIGLLSANPELSREVAGSVGQLEIMAKRAANLTRRLLTFSRQQVVQIRVIELDAVVENLLTMLRSLLPENIELIRRRPPEPLWIEGDSGLIEQVVTNLCVNSRDAMMPKGGRITIAIARVTLGEGAASANVDARPGVFVRLTVEDEGSGMDAATLQHIFEPFFTTKEMGTGLGLATVYGIAKQHHGWIEVQSEVGRGSAFHVFLPEVKAAKADAPAAAPEARKADGCILLVEDEGPVRIVAARILKKFGYRVLEAVDGEDAIRVWREHAGEIDLLFSDMVMPKGISGLDLGTRFKTERPDLKVVITSGYSVDLTSERVLSGPGVVFLAKPYFVDGLLKVLRECLES